MERPFSLIFKRPYIWLRRFRKRKGYGVHSPFAFNLITYVIYEKLPYYKYAFLQKEEARLRSFHEKRWGYESLKIKRLLFRLANFIQPADITDIGLISSSALYLQNGCLKARYQAIAREEYSSEMLPQETGLVYLHCYRHPDFIRQVLSDVYERSSSSSVILLEGVRYSSAVHSIWKELRQHPKTGITFDLYDLGIIFFDKSRPRQDYIVNF